MDVHAPVVSPRPGLAIALCAAIALAAAWTVLPTMDSAPRDPTADEGVYLRYMAALAEGGPAAFPRVFEAYHADERAWVHPSPLRVAFLAASALWGAAFGVTPESLSALALTSHLLLVLATWAFARRRFGDAVALGGAALLAFSPLLLGLSRLALADTFTTLTLALAIWTFLEFAREPRRPARLAAFSAAFALAALTKEMAALLAIPFVAFAALDAGLRREPRDLVPHAVALGAAGLATLAVLVLAAGSLEVVVATARTTVGSTAWNPYTVRTGSGPWFRYVVDFLLLSPGPTLLAIGAAGVIALRAPRGERPSSEASLVLVAAGLLLGLAFLTKNARYGAGLEVPGRLLAAWFLAALLRPGRSALATASYALAIALLCAIDASTFRELWVRRGLYDPLTAPLLMTRELMPMR